MKRKVQILKWSAISVLVALICMVGAVAGGLFWLSNHYSREHPLDLLPHIPKIQSYFAGHGLNISADKLELYYEDAPVIRVEGLRVLGANNELAVYLEQAAVKVANGRLFQLAISPKVIEAKGMTLRLVRGPDDIVRIAGLRLNTTTSGPIPADTRGVVEWLDALPANRLWGRLKNVRVQGLTLLLRDEPQRAEWVLENGKLSIDRYAGRGERGSLLATVRRIVGPNVLSPKGVRGLPIPVLITLERNDEDEALREQVMLEAKFGTLNAAVVGDYLPAQIQDMLTGRGTLALGSVLTRGNRLGLPWLTLRLKNAALNLPSSAGYSKPLQLPQLEATVSYIPSPTDALQIKSVSFNSPRGNLFVISGTIASATTDPILNLSGFSPGGEVQAIIDLFPDADPKFAKTLKFLRNNIQDATYRNLVAHSTLKPKAFPGCGDACGGLTIDAELLGGKVAFLNGLPAVEIIPPNTAPNTARNANSSNAPISARFYWRGQALAVIAPQASIAEQRASSVWVALNNIFSPSPKILTVSGSLSGDLNRLIGHLNNIPAIGGDIPGTYTGSYKSLMQLQLPLIHKISPTFASATLTVQGVTQNTTVQNLPILGAKVLAAPRVNISISPEKLLVIQAPSAKLEGGALRFHWQQNLQPKAPPQHALAASGMLPAKLLHEYIGTGTISASGAIGVNFATSTTQPNIWAFTVSAEAKGATLAVPRFGYTKPANEPLTLTANGQYTANPAAPILALQRLTLKGTQTSISGTAMLPLNDWVKGRIALPNLTFGANRFGLSLENQTLTLKGDTLDLRTTSLKGNGKPLPNGLNLQTTLKTVLFSKGSLRNLELAATTRFGVWDLETLRATVPNGAANIRRTGNALDINIRNLGAVLSTTGYYGGIKGGNLFGQMRGQGSTLRGELKLSDFELRNPPIMLRILGLLSLEQLVAGTDTTKFSSGKIPLTITPEAFTLNNAHFTGPSMDLRFNGSYGRLNSQLNIQGNLAPAIPFNRLVSKVPLIGTILTGSQDGVVVADFRLKGPISAPEINVLPLSVLTPGLLKDLFRGGNPNPSPNPN